MKDGIIKVATASPALRVADCQYNGEQIMKAMEEAAAKKAKLLVLPELSVTGYTCGDLFLQQALLQGARDTLMEIAKFSKGLSLLTFVGVPLVNNGKLYNCAAAVYEGKVLGVVPKTNLPNYAEFYEARNFMSAPEKNTTILLGDEEVPFGSKLLFRCSELQEFCVGAEICEDLWVPVSPSASHMEAGATIIANLTASNETAGKRSYRRDLVKSQSARLVCGYLYAGAGMGESVTDLVFSGHSIIAENGEILVENELFSQSPLYTEIDVELLAGERRRMSTFGVYDASGYTIVPFHMELEETPLSRDFAMFPFWPKKKELVAPYLEDVLQIQAQGLARRLSHTHSKTAVIGISGGLDSCLALLVAVKAMDLLGRPHEDVLAVTMPCFGTTARTKNNAEILCQRLGVTLRCVAIGDAVLQHFKDIGHDPDNHNVVFENAQARERTQVIMDISNETGGLVVGTGDLSELALGWATYNGDHMSMYGVNASIPKTLVRQVVHHAAMTSQDTELRDVLLDILDTPVSPELLPAQQDAIAQKTEDIVGPYELHDFFLFYIIRYGFHPSKIYRLAQYVFAGMYDNETILKWLKTFYRRFFAQQFKRSCVPDGPKAGPISLSPRGDWRMPSDACAKLWMDQLEQL